MKKRKRIIGIGILLGIIAVAVILWPRQSLVWCTTKPLTNGRAIVRVTLLVPRSYDQKNLHEFREKKSDHYVMSSGQPFGFVPQSARETLHLESPRSAIEFTVFNRADGPNIDGSVHRLRDRLYSIGMTQRAGRYVGGRPGVWIIYESLDKRDFESNYQRILSSAKVLPYEVLESAR